eukprot:3778350-Pyramimonas_sp.AAC.2
MHSLRCIAGKWDWTSMRPKEGMHGPSGQRVERGRKRDGYGCIILRGGVSPALEEVDGWVAFIAGLCTGSETLKGEQGRTGVPCGSCPSSRAERNMSCNKKPYV